MERKCKACEATLPRTNKTYCNRKCVSDGMRKSFTKKCKVCDTTFTTVRSSKRVTCCRACNSINRRRVAESGVAEKASQKAKEITPTLPHMGRFETHMHAKVWTIKSPEGTVHKCRNLMLWLRENQNLYEGTPKQAFSGITMIKLSSLGRVKRNAQSWKGWTLIEWGD